MSYRNDQFYKLSEEAGDPSGATFNNSNGTANWYHPDADNPRFVFPDRQIRTWDRPTVYNNLESKVTLLKRGFIRSIPVNEGDAVRKCQFQFNPQTLSLDMTTTQDTLNFYSQDPGQFAQPLAGYTEMTFTLLFDRTMEINNAVTTGSFAGKPGGLQNPPTLSERPDPRNPWATGDPSYVGVLRDISALYGVIGQGIDPRRVQQQVEQTRANLQAEARSVGEDLDPTQLDAALGNAPDIIAANAGNYAILVPNPIRMVFSSLYMVEGVVSGTSVTFTKFNSAFVPIQATVSLSITAQHVGFAKRDSFVSWAMERSQEAAAQSLEEDQALARQSYDAVKSELSSWELALFAGDAFPNGYQAELADFMPDGGGGAVDKYRMHVNRLSTGPSETLRALFAEGATLQLSASYVLYTDMPQNEIVPVGQERRSARLQYYLPPQVINTLEDLEAALNSKTNIFWTLEGSTMYVGPTISTDSVDTPVVAPNGGRIRQLFVVDILLGHAGTQLVGHGQTRLDGDGSDYYDKVVKGTVDIRWTLHGDPVAGYPLVESEDVFAPGSTSGVS